MRASSNAVWLLLGLAVLALLASRLGRSLGAVGIIVTVVVLVVIAGVALEIVRSRLRPTGPGGVTQVTKNVTPHEPALPPGSRPPPASVGAPTPSVIIVDPPAPGERLATRLEALDRLRADGLVTDEEYEAKRAKLIADL